MAPMTTRVNLKCELHASIEKIFKVFSRSRPRATALTKIRLFGFISRDVARVIDFSEAGVEPPRESPTKTQGQKPHLPRMALRIRSPQATFPKQSIQRCGRRDYTSKRNTSHPTFLEVNVGDDRPLNLASPRYVFVGKTSFSPMPHLYGCTRESQPFDNARTFQ
jgi:hypothetical protein